MTRANTVLTRLRPQLEQEGVGELESLTIYSYWFHVTALAAVLLADDLQRRHPGLRVERLVSRAHRYDLYEDAAPMGHIPLRTLLLRRFDAVHPVSDDGTRYLQQRYPDHADKVSTRRLGTRDPGELVDSRQTPFHVVSCSFVIPVKRVDRFAGILKMLRDEGIDARWTHFGSGDDLDRVRDQATELLGADVVSMPGYVRNTELAQRYRELHPSVFMNLSASEGVPVSIMEAAAQGLPVVATDVGGVREIVHDGENGHLLPEDFTDRQAADVLARLARATQEEHAETCRRSRQVWEADFDMTKVYPDFAAELRGQDPASRA